MTFDPTYLNNLVLVLTGFGGAFLAALWVSLVIWTYRDIKSRARDNLVFILAPLVVALLSLPGFLIYLVLRPQFTLEEEYQRTLEEEALLQAIEDQPVCPGCERLIASDWQVCPNCHTKIKKPCQKCGKLMDLPWNVCPFCATPEYGLRTEDVNIPDTLYEDIKEFDVDEESSLIPESLPIQVEEKDQGNLSGEL
jgi:RNA polymerase subunit RPABC4/transcription elongation factor Spt4